MKPLLIAALCLVSVCLMAQPGIQVSGSSAIQGSVALQVLLGSAPPNPTNPPSGSSFWVRSIPAGFNVFAAGVAADTSNNALVAGAFTTSIDMGGGVIPSTGGLNGFLAKYSSANAFVWGKAFTGTGENRAFDVAVDTSGNVFVVGYFKKTITFGATVLTATDPFNIGVSDIFIAKYNSAGVVQWAKGYGSTSDDVSNGVCVDPSGNPILSCSFFGTVSFGGITNVATGGSSDFAVVKLLSSDGSTVWAISHGGAGSDTDTGITTDSSGNVVVVGGATGAIDLGGGSTGTGGSYIAKYAAANGAYTWGRILVVTSIGGVAVEQSSSKVFVTGAFPGPTDFGSGTPISTRNGQGGVFTAAYTGAAGAYVTAKVYGGTGDLGQMVAVDTSGNIAVTGTADGLVDFTGTGLFAAGKGYFVNVMTTSLVNSWYERSTQPVNHGFGVAFDSASRLLAIGGYQNTISLGGLSLTGVSGLQYGFVVQYFK